MRRTQQSLVKHRRIVSGGRSMYVATYKHRRVGGRILNIPTEMIHSVNNMVQRNIVNPAKDIVAKAGIAKDDLLKLIKSSLKTSKRGGTISTFT